MYVRAIVTLHCQSQAVKSTGLGESIMLFAHHSICSPGLAPGDIGITTCALQPPVIPVCSS